MGTELKNNDNIIDLDLSVTRKKRFRIDGDNDRILELNTSDMNILSRLQDAYPKLVKLSQEAAAEMPDNMDDDASIEATAKTLKETDNKMRKIIDEIFDAPVSEVCAPNGSMYDPFNGQFRFEIIIDKLSNLYETSFNNEFKKMSERMKKHTAKYTKKK